MKTGKLTLRFSKALMLLMLVLLLASLGAEYINYNSPSPSDEFLLYVNTNAFYNQLQLFVALCLLAGILCLFINNRRSPQIYLVSLILIITAYLLLFAKYYFANRQLEIPYSLGQLLQTNFGLVDLTILLASVFLLLIGVKTSKRSEIQTELKSV